MRMAFRRHHVRQILSLRGDVWPICESAGIKPENWPGWPGGKKFAFVLTHDVEGQRGLDRVKQLAELEMEFGFRSSFNFVPEGGYRVPSELRSWLIERGFEVGVHDLHHDGKLYSDKKSFLNKAQRINHYLNEWNAVGFRSGFMLRNLDWIHELDIRYDASTFDTDPFEPQPDGANTIFPFWVPRRSEIRSQGSEASSLNSSRDRVVAIASDSRRQLSTLNHTRSGYVDLPYTLAQDSTLFLLLRENTAEIWLRKLDWVAKHGGMALVNIHPDYVAFSKKGRSFAEYPEDRLRELLTYISAKYSGTFWHAPPRNVADWYSEFWRRQSGTSSNGSPS